MQKFKFAFEITLDQLEPYFPEMSAEQLEGLLKAHETSLQRSLMEVAQNYFEGLNY